MELADIIKLVAKYLSRTRNFPQTEDGVRDITESVARISEAIGIEAEPLLQRCADSSEFCPSDADLWTAAREIKEEIRRKAEAASPSQMAQWRKKYGPPQPFTVDAEFLGMFERARKNKERYERLWSELKKKFPAAATAKGQWPDWLVLSKAARELGYPDIADAWEKSVKW